MSNILVISGHPDLSSSYTNKVILAELEKGLDNISIRYLDRLYPDFKVDVKAEQQALINADIVVLQFPYYWYSVPALLKKWIDDVFSYGFAYGSDGDKLKGKRCILSFTIGGPAEQYSPLGSNHFSIESLLHPLQQTIYLTQMHYEKPVYTNSMIYLPGIYNTQEEVEARAIVHSERLIAQIKALVK